MKNHVKLSIGIVFLLIIMLCTTSYSMKKQSSTAKKIGWAALAGAAVGGGYLLYKKISSYIQEKLTMMAFLNAAIQNDCATITKLLNQGIDINATGPDGRTALMRAAAKGHIEAVQCLLSNPQIRVDQPDNIGGTALIYAVSGNHCPIIKMLLESGADINKTDPDGNTVLIVAVFFGHIEAVQCLLSSSHIVIDHANKQGGTALLAAIDQGNKLIIKQLLDAGADPELVTKVGMTPRNAASEIGLPENYRAAVLADPFARGLPQRLNIPVKIESDPEVLSLINKAIIKKRGGVNPFIEPKKVNTAEVEKEI
jgi:hypothetical protein